MRKYVKRNLLQLLNTMQEAIGMLATAGGEYNMAVLCEMLADQQDAAVALGNEIEASEGEGMEVVHLLEEYCELLWVISQETNGSAIENGVNQLSQRLQQIRLALRAIPVQRDVVFLPYKASMWDCMESVWEAANADEECNAIVMPIPYFDLKDGQVADRHYEGELFPEYVPITDYRSVPLEELRPDIIFIHNPFDNCNKVTSVLPQFYSKELRQVTRRLVYIPYFVTNGAVFVTHREWPAYYRMDFIVTQNENSIESFASSIPRQKFLPLGSPIADRVIKLEREKPPIPEAWKAMLPNGKDFGTDRVVMLNTSISLLLRERERFLNKIEYIFEVVKNTSGIRLVWRPHPLLHATIDSMGEKYAKQFYNMEKRFVEEKIGVLDTNPDVGVTVALCDGYIGETASSMIHMFGIAGKPRFYINLQIPRASASDIQEEYIVDGYCKDASKEYFLLDKHGWVAVKRTEQEEPELLFRIPDREYIRDRAYCGMELREGKLWLYPDNAQGALVYDIETGGMRKVFGEEAKVTKPLDGKEKVLCRQENQELEDGETSHETMILAADSACINEIKAERFLRGNACHEWYECEQYCMEDYFGFLLATKATELAGNLGMYPTWLANLDGSCGRKVLQAVKESFK